MDVIILAGGLGSRLRPVVHDRPKCMALVAGRPFLWYVLRNLMRFKVESVVLSVGYLREFIFEWVEKNRASFPFSIDFVVEERPLGTGGGIRFALQKVKSDDAVVLNGDTFFDVDLDGFFCRHCSRKSLVTVALKSMLSFDRYGSVSVNAATSKIVRFNEKQFCREGLINGGIYAIRKDSAFWGNKPESFSFETEVLQKQCGDAGDVSGFEFTDYFIDIGIPEDYRLANLHFVEYSGFDTLLLDRDGVINQLRKNDYVKTWDEFVFIPGILSLLASWAKSFKHIFIVTNQRGVGKGVMTESALLQIHERMCEEIARHGGRVDKIYYCTSLSGADPRRKPGPGMFDDILRDFPDVRRESCLMLGDVESDMQFAANCSISGALV